MITPVAFANIKYQTYIIFAVINAAIFPTVYFFYPETAYRSLEEMDAIFHKTTSIFNLVGVAAREPRRYDRQGNLLIAYEQTGKQPLTRHVTRSTKLTVISQTRQSDRRAWVTALRARTAWSLWKMDTRRRAPTRQPPAEIRKSSSSVTTTTVERLSRLRSPSHIPGSKVTEYRGAYLLVTFWIISLRSPIWSGWGLLLCGLAHLFSSSTRPRGFDWFWRPHKHYLSISWVCPGTFGAQTAGSRPQYPSICIGYVLGTTPCRPGKR